jgi:hypothetical protein
LGLIAEKSIEWPEVSDISKIRPYPKTIAEITRALDGHILDKGFLVGRYRKTQ